MLRVLLLLMCGTPLLFAGWPDLAESFTSATRKDVNAPAAAVRLTLDKAEMTPELADKTTLFLKETLTAAGPLKPLAELHAFADAYRKGTPNNTIVESRFKQAIALRRQEDQVLSYLCVPLEKLDSAQKNLLTSYVGGNEDGSNTVLARIARLKHNAEVALLAHSEKEQHGLLLKMLQTSAEDASAFHVVALERGRKAVEELDGHAGSLQELVSVLQKLPQVTEKPCADVLAEANRLLTLRTVRKALWEKTRTLLQQWATAESVSAKIGVLGNNLPSFDFAAEHQQAVVREAGKWLVTVCALESNLPARIEPDRLVEVAWSYNQKAARIPLFRSQIRLPGDVKLSAQRDGAYLIDESNFAEKAKNDRLDFYPPDPEEPGVSSKPPAGVDEEYLRKTSGLKAGMFTLYPTEKTRAAIRYNRLREGLMGALSTGGPHAALKSKLAVLVGDCAKITPREEELCIALTSLKSIITTLHTKLDAFRFTPE